VNRLYEEVCEVLDVTVPPRREPRRPGDLRAAYFDIARARRELGWEPSVSLANGLAQTTEFFRAELGRETAPAGGR
jgi:nucleoside-diphosphate-sugar epimerase